MTTLPTGKTALSFTGSVQSFTVPGTGTVTLKMWAAGGGGGYTPSGSIKAGAGGYTTVVFKVNFGDVLDFTVPGGGGGGTQVGGPTATNAGGAGGYPDGGDGGLGAVVQREGAGGGSASVKKNGTVTAVAGGGGAAGAGAGGGGGGTSGASNGGFATGGSQSAGGVNSDNANTNYQGGSFKGGKGYASTTPNRTTSTGDNLHPGGGGGGGFFGGAAGDQSQGGAGGSGFIASTDGSFVSGALTAASGSTVPNSGDTDYATGIGAAGTTSNSTVVDGTPGGNGRIVVSFDNSITGTGAPGTVTMGAPAAFATVITNLPSGKTVIPFSGAHKQYLVAGPGQIIFKLWAGGGGAGRSGSTLFQAGGGGFTTYTLNVVGGELLDFNVGGGGGFGNQSSVSGADSGGAGAYPDGGDGGLGSNFNRQGGGGGSSTILKNGTVLAVAGAGGGAAGASAGGAGGGSSGGAVGDATGGSQTTGGTNAGQADANYLGGSFHGGKGFPSTIANRTTSTGDTSRPGGGGGGGYFGGGGGDATTGGGGGSGYINATDSGYVTGALTSGSGGTPGGSGDTDYTTGIGVGGTDVSSPSVNGTAGGNGQIVATYVAGATTNGFLGTITVTTPTGVATITKPAATSGSIPTETITVLAATTSAGATTSGAPATTTLTPPQGFGSVPAAITAALPSAIGVSTPLSAGSAGVSVSGGLGLVPVTTTIGGGGVATQAFVNANLAGAITTDPGAASVSAAATVSGALATITTGVPVAIIPVDISGALGTISLTTQPTAIATAGTSAFPTGLIGTVALSEIDGSAGGGVTAFGDPGTITTAPPAAVATVAVAPNPAMPFTTLSAPTATAVGPAVTSGDLATVTLTPADAIAQPGVTGAGDLATIDLSAPTGVANTGVTATSTLVIITVAAPDGQPHINASATGAIGGTVALSAPTPTTSLGANVVGTMPSSSLSPPQAIGSASAAPSGALPTITLTAAVATGTGAAQAVGAGTPDILVFPADLNAPTEADINIPIDLTVGLSTPDVDPTLITAGANITASDLLQVVLESFDGVGRIPAAILADLPDTMLVSSPEASAGGGVTALPDLVTITVTTAPTATVTVTESEVQPLPTVTVAAPLGSAHVAATAVGDLLTILITEPDGIAAEGSFATADLGSAEIVLAGPEASATGAADAFAQPGFVDRFQQAIALIGVSAPQAQVSAGVLFNATLPNPITIVEPVAITFKALSVGAPIGIITLKPVLASVSVGGVVMSLSTEGDLPTLMASAPEGYAYDGDDAGLITPKLRLKRTLVRGRAPTSLLPREITLNEADGVLHHRDLDGNVVGLPYAALMADGMVPSGASEGLILRGDGVWIDPSPLFTAPVRPMTAQTGANELVALSEGALGSENRAPSLNRAIFRPFFVQKPLKITNFGVLVQISAPATVLAGICAWDAVLGVPGALQTSGSLDVSTTGIKLTGQVVTLQPGWYASLVVVTGTSAPTLTGVLAPSGLSSSFTPQGDPSAAYVGVISPPPAPDGFETKARGYVLAELEPA